MTGPLRSIGKNAFGDCFALSDLTLPDSLLTIDNSCFYGCRNLRELTIPSSVGRIGYAAFAYCSRLEATLPDSVTDVGTNAFLNTSSLYYAGTLSGRPWGAEKQYEYYEGDLAFSSADHTEVIHCKESAIGDIAIPAGVTAIAEETFANCVYIQSVAMPNSVTSIGDCAFLHCLSLTRASVSGNIGVGAFYECFGLQTVVIADGAERIGVLAFGYDIGLESVSVSASVTSIGDGAFRLSLSADEVAAAQANYNAAVAAGETQIDGVPLAVLADVLNYPNGRLTHAYYCGTQSDWNNVTLGAQNDELVSALVYHTHTYQEETTPATCTSQGRTVYTCLCGSTYTTVLPKLPHTDENNDNYCEVCGWYTVLSGDDGSISWRYDPDTDTLIVSGTGSMRTYSYSSGKTTAPWSPFCNTVKHLVIEDGITRVGACAFYGCVLLEDVSLPDSVTYLAYNAFQNCYALQRIALSEFVTGLGIGVFYNCTGLTEIYYNAAISGSFNTGSKEFYSAGTSGEGVTVTIGPAVESVPANLFHISDSDPAVRRSKIKTVIFENGATEIGSQAFRNCDKMTSLTLPNSIETISENAFNGCYNLRNVAYPGAQEDWDAIVIGENNAPLLGASLSLHIHTYVEEVITPATCTQEGLKRYTCSQCGKTFTAVAPISHPDADFDGVCDRCGLDS